MGRIAEIGKLTPREAMFLREVIKGSSYGAAYLAVTKFRPDGKPISEDNARKMGSRMLKRIRTKVDWPRLMESAGHGEMRLLVELNARLNAMETHFYQDKKVADCEDNGTRMRATELLADLLGKRKTELKVSGSVQFTAAELSPAERDAWLKQNLDRLAKLLEAQGWKRPDERPA